MKRWINAAAQLACLVLLATILFPLFMAGIVAGVAWLALVAGFKFSDDMLDWITDDRKVWSVRIVPEQGEE